MKLIKVPSNHNVGRCVGGPLAGQRFSHPGTETPIFDEVAKDIFYKALSEHRRVEPGRYVLAGDEWHWKPAEAVQ